MDKDERIKLKMLLKELISCIEGEWFLGDGGLLGLMREGDLLSFDNDLDIYLLPGSKIVIPDNSFLKLNKYYMDSKISDKFSENWKPKNAWQEFLRYTRHLFPGVNRGEHYQKSSLIYREQYIVPQFSLPYIDIYYLKNENEDRYTIDWWNQFYYKSEADNLITNHSLGFEVKIPSNAEEILTRQYGNWRKENRLFKY